MKNMLDLNKRAWDNTAEKYDDRTETPISDIFATFTDKLREELTSLFVHKLEIGKFRTRPEAPASLRLLMFYILEQLFETVGL